MTGKFIVFEGVEGAGKTTQIQRALEWIETSRWAKQLTQAYGIESPLVVVTREPGGTEIGKKIRQLLLDPGLSATEEICDEAELLLYAADRAQHVVQYIQPHLEAGRIVLCDRFTDSTIAYQGYGRSLNLELIDQLNHIATAGLKSDLTLWFNVDVAQGLARARGQTLAEQGQNGAALNTDGDRMEANDLAFHQRVQQGFAAIAAHNPLLHTIDANQPIDQVTQQVQTVLQTAFAQWHPQLLSNF